MRDLRWENVDSSLCRSRNLRSLHRFTGLCSRNLRISYQRDQRESIRNFDKRNDTYIFTHLSM
ncbi:hypothetical protein ALC56_13356 [Trachymyrmex septentrionalis]|uniref:Uncharacterized protein n=1 Tax=Trachymyrmex septentrionalis TaxID=34720 RepID=A0A195EW87_9HYME|nr:hypothetical protein ALC56_13356 [Trachymyrmex septentrionalis]